MITKFCIILSWLTPKWRKINCQLHPLFAIAACSNAQKLATGKHISLPNKPASPVRIWLLFYKLSKQERRAGFRRHSFGAKNRSYLVNALITRQWRRYIIKSFNFLTATIFCLVFKLSWINIIGFFIICATWQSFLKIPTSLKFNFDKESSN